MPVLVSGTRRAWLGTVSESLGAFPTLGSVMTTPHRTRRACWTLTIAGATLAAIASVTLAACGNTVEPRTSTTTAQPSPTDTAAAPTVVSLTFNDGLVTGYTNAAPVLETHNMNGTFYVVSSWVDKKSTGYMASWQLDELYRDGNEIGGEGRTHKDLTKTYYSKGARDYAYKKEQVCDDRQRLVQLGYHPESFVYPYGAYDAKAEAIVKACGYRSARAGGGLSMATSPAAESLPPKDAYAIRSMALPQEPVSLESLKKVVTHAVDHGGGWVPISFNDVCDKSDATYAICMRGYQPIDAGVLSAFLDWLQDGAPAGVSVKTVSDVMGAPPPPPLPPRTTDVSLTFDDGLKSAYGLRSLLAAHHVHATFYINSGTVDRHYSGMMSWAQIRDLAADGNDIGGHTVTHVDLTKRTYDSVHHQVCDDRARLIQQGFKPVSFAYPFGAFDALAERIVKACGYQTARTAGSVTASGPIYAENEPPEDPYATRVLGTSYNGPISLQSLADAVNAAAKHGGGWLQLVFHEVCYQGDPDFESCMKSYRPVDDATLSSFLDWLQYGAPAGVRVRDVAEVMQGG
jgi:peptidoglycan/xylan/chitin deacetylase (PgdA/CDA1 family)